MTKTPVTNHLSRPSPPDRIHPIGHHSAVLVTRLRERAERATRGQFGPPPFHSFEEAVLAYGRPFTEALVLPDRRLGSTRLVGADALTSAFRSARTADPLIDCEGFAMPVSLGNVVEHAWLVNRDGRVIDPTWDDADACGYVGVPLTLQHMAAWRRPNCYGHLGVSCAQLFEFGLPPTALS